MTNPKGLYGKYIVFDARTGLPVDDPIFVLKLADPHAQAALLAYADSCQEENPLLAADIRRRVWEVQQ